MISQWFSENIVTAIVFGIMQVTMISLIGIIATRLFVSRRPRLASSIACTTIAVIFVTTIAIPVRVPEFMLIASQVSKDRAVATIPRDAVISDTHEHESTEPVESSFALLSHFRSFLQLESWKPERESQTSQWPPTSLVFLVMLGLFVGLGLTRVLVSVVSAIRLTLSSREVSNIEPKRVLADIKRVLEVQTSVRLLVSNGVTSAGVCGFFRPCILLPNDWTNWSDAELRSVLSHELSHIANRDFLWRVVACLTGALHFFNPMVHYLIRMMVLAQELAADISAARIVQRRTYLRSLSTLALRREQSVVGWNRVPITPIFSGHLIRRIKMLYGNEKFVSSVTTWKSRVIATAFIATVGVIGFSIRGYAEPPANESGKGVAAADSPDERIARVSSASKSEKIFDGLFQRPSVSSADVVENETGMLELRMEDILGRPHFSPLIAIANHSIANELKNEFELDEAPPIDLRAIDRVFGAFSMKIRHSLKKGDSRLMFDMGVPPAVIEFNRDVNIEEWIRQYVPDVVERQKDEHEFFKVKQIPAVGPSPLLIGRHDESRICVGTARPPGADEGEQGETESDEKFLASVEHEASVNRSDWAIPFDQVKGGLLTIAVTNKEFQILDKIETESLSGFELEASRLCHNIARSVKTIAMGLDLSDDGSRFAVRIHVTTVDPSKHETQFEQISRLVELGKQAVTSEDQEQSTAPEQHDKAAEIQKQILTNLVVEKAVASDGSHYVAIRFFAEDPNMIGLFASVVMEDLPLGDEGNEQ